MFVPSCAGLTPMDMVQWPPNPGDPDGDPQTIKSLHDLFRRTHSERLREGRHEANVAVAVRDRLADRISALSRTDPLLLNQLCEEAHTTQLLRRFDVDLAAVVPTTVLDDRGIALAAELHATRRTLQADGASEPSDVPPTARAADALRRMRDALRADASGRASAV